MDVSVVDFEVSQVKRVTAVVLEKKNVNMAAGQMSKLKLFHDEFTNVVISFKMASVIHQSQKRPTDAYGCNWLERLRQIKRVRNKAAAETFSVPSSPIGKGSPSSGLRPPSLQLTGLTDFTEYIMK